MTPSLQSLGIDRLTRDERIALVQAIWNTIAAETNHHALCSEAQHRELERRIADDDANPNDVVPWSTVKAEILSRLQVG